MNMIWHVLSKGMAQSRSSCPGVFCQKGVLRNFAKFTEKHLCQSLFFNKVAGLRHRCFPVNFVKLLRTPFLAEHLRWLLLTVKYDMFTDRQTRLHMAVKTFKIEDYVTCARHFPFLLSKCETLNSIQFP